MYKYEMHLHTRRCSACACATGEEMVISAKQKGYTGIVLTNHFYRGNTAIDRQIPWEDFVKEYQYDYLETKEAGEKHDIEVLFGIEEGYGGGKEVLIYGIQPEKLIETPNFIRMDIAEISAFVRENDGFIACAHPFRDRDYISEPHKIPDITLFDAAESYNACNTPEDNEMAEQLCKRTGLPRISGGDVHIAGRLGKAGVAFYDRITNDRQLVAALKAGRYKLIIDGETEE